MTLTQNFIYQVPAMPGDTVVPTDLNPFKNIRRINATADVSSVLTAGVFCYLTAGTQANDVTPTVTEFGDVDAEGVVCIVEIVRSDTNFAATTDRPINPNKMPNGSCTLTDYTHTAEKPMIVIPLEEGMIVWCVGSSNGTFDTTFGTRYIFAANGMIKATGAPTGATPDKLAMTVTSMATTSNQNWALVRFEGPRMYDSS
jgi:hypothetical protein